MLLLEASGSCRVWASGCKPMCPREAEQELRQKEPSLLTPELTLREGARGPRRAGPGPGLRLRAPGRPVGGRLPAVLWPGGWVGLAGGGA